KRPSSVTGNSACQRSLMSGVIGTSIQPGEGPPGGSPAARPLRRCPSAGLRPAPPHEWGGGTSSPRAGRSLYFTTAARASWPSAKMSASTRTVSPTARLAGKRPASISGMTASMTTRRRPSTSMVGRCERVAEGRSKPIVEAEAEIEKCAWTAGWFAENGERLLAEQRVESTGAESYVRFHPLGVILAVMPWNFPFWQAFRAGLPALTAGNVMLLKHSSNVPQSALAIEEVFREAGVPEGVFQSLLIGSAAVERLISDHRVAGVTLTGSDKAGSLVAESAGRALKKTVLE